MEPLPPGEVISVQQGLIRHYGVVVDDGVHGPRVISNSRQAGKVVEEPLAQFTGGAALRRHGFLGNLAPGEVVARAQARLGQPYRLTDANCEHLVREVHGVPRKSPQLRAYTAVAIAGVASLATLVFGGMFRGRRGA